MRAFDTATKFIIHNIIIDQYEHYRKKVLLFLKALWLSILAIVIGLEELQETRLILFKSKNIIANFIIV